jgi:cell division protein FtsB
VSKALGARAKIVFLLCLALAFGLLAFSLLGPDGGAQAELRGELERLVTENVRLREQNRRLALEVEALKNRPDYLEKVARDELGLVKPDELIFQLKSTPDGGTPAEEEEEATGP